MKLAYGSALRPSSDFLMRIAIDVRDSVGAGLTLKFRFSFNEKPLAVSNFSIVNCAIARNDWGKVDYISFQHGNDGC